LYDGYDTGWMGFSQQSRFCGFLLIEYLKTGSITAEAEKGDK
jgi:hypothetical protein